MRAVAFEVASLLRRGMTARRCVLTPHGASRMCLEKHAPQNRCIVKKHLFSCKETEVSYEHANLSSKKSSRGQKYIGNPCTENESAIFVEKNRPRSLAGTHMAPEFAFSQRGCCKTHIGVQQREQVPLTSSAFSHKRC